MKHAPLTEQHGRCEKKTPSDSIGARFRGALEKSHFPARGNGGGGGGHFFAKNIKDK
jgi:hypothetical protein